MKQKQETTLRIEGIKKKTFKGYCVIVGLKKGSGSFRYIKGTKKQALKLGESMKTEGKIFWPEVKTLFIDIEKKELKKCDISSCNSLCESSEQYCLKCEDIMFEAQQEYSEQQKEELLYG